MRSNTLSVHYKKHSTEKPFPCPIDGCNKAYTEKGNLAKHLKIKHKGARLQKDSKSVLTASPKATENPVADTQPPIQHPVKYEDGSSIGNFTSPQTKVCSPDLSTIDDQK